MFAGLVTTLRAIGLATIVKCLSQPGAVTGREAAGGRRGSTPWTAGTDTGTTSSPAVSLTASGRTTGTAGQTGEQTGPSSCHSPTLQAEHSLQRGVLLRPGHISQGRPTQAQAGPAVGGGGERQAASTDTPTTLRQVTHSSYCPSLTLHTHL